MVAQQGGKMRAAVLSGDEVGWAFRALGDPDEHCKIVVTPSGGAAPAG
jgi:hypothetical protein